MGPDGGGGNDDIWWGDCDLSAGESDLSAEDCDAAGAASCRPFIEAKEAISGYFLINAKNLEEATTIAQSCPLLVQGISDAIEVRHIMTGGG
jgi:YCII-related domain